MTPAEFAAKWAGSTAHRARRRAGALHRPLPDARRSRRRTRPTRPATWYAFEKGAEKLGGGDGFADVWKRGHFAWEYKGKRKDLAAAYRQLLRLPRGAREPAAPRRLRPRPLRGPHQLHGHRRRGPPPSPSTTSAADPAEPLRILRAVFSDPEALRPTRTRQRAHRGGRPPVRRAWPSRLRDRGHDPQAVAHFLDKLLFCLFAEDAGLLPKGLLARLADATRARARRPSSAALGELFAQDGRRAAALRRRARSSWFNGGLFDGAEVLAARRPPRSTSLRRGRASSTGRRSSRPSSARSSSAASTPTSAAQLGAHYTDRDVDRAARRAGAHGAAAARVRGDAGRGDRGSSSPARKVTAPTPPAAKTRSPSSRRSSTACARCRVLDPACGSGNFLYLALRALKDLEREAILWGSLDAAPAACRSPRSGPQAVHRHRDQPLRRRARPGDHLDRRDPVDAPPRLRLPARPDPAAARQHRDAGRAPRPVRPGRTRGRPSGPTADVHRRQPAVPGRQAAATAAWATSTSTRSSSVFDGRVPDMADFVLLLAREGAGA